MKEPSTRRTDRPRRDDMTSCLQEAERDTSPYPGEHGEGQEYQSEERPSAGSSDVTLLALFPAHQFSAHLTPTSPRIRARNVGTAQKGQSNLLPPPRGRITVHRDSPQSSLAHRSTGKWYGRSGSLPHRVTARQAGRQIIAGNVQCPALRGKCRLR